MTAMEVHGSGDTAQMAQAANVLVGRRSCRVGGRGSSTTNEG